MDSQEHLSQPSQDSLMPSTELSHPTTPKRRSASLSGSPGPSNAFQAVPTERAKFTSPEPTSTSSMTPPPSSQVPLARSSVRTPTPPTPQLTSPPLTAKWPHQPSMLTESAAALYSPEQIDSASPDQLRAMVNELTTTLRDVRLSAAHHKLQYNMAVMENEESTKRMSVELIMAQREIDVLRDAEEKRRSAAVSPMYIFQESAINSANALMITELNRQCQMLQGENDELRDCLDQQKRLTEHREGELAGLLEENMRLKARIRKNRDHIAQFLPYQDQMSDQGSPRSLFGTPHQATPKHRPHRAPPPLSAEGSRGPSNFDILLRADQILNEKTTTAPSTPTRLQAPKARLGHNRGTHSMSSLPQTPTRAGHHPHNVVPRTPPTFAAVNIPQSAPAAHYQRSSLARRDSSNSTITASSVDDEEAFTDREDNEVEESQASQMATNMLRHATTPKQVPVPSSQTSSQLVQSKIFGHVKKGSTMSRPGEYEKRRLPSSADHHGSPSKKNRVDPGLGLGIGGLMHK